MEYTVGYSVEVDVSASTTRQGGLVLWCSCNGSIISVLSRFYALGGILMADSVTADSALSLSELGSTVFGHRGLRNIT